LCTPTDGAEKLTKLKTFVTDDVRIYRTVNPSKTGGWGGSLVAFQVDIINGAQYTHPFHFFSSSKSKVILLDFLKTKSLNAQVDTETFWN
jgi:hypothetical protein